MCETSDNANEAETLIAEHTLIANKQIRENTQLGRSRGKSRRMKLLERMGCFAALPTGVTISRAITPEDLDDAYRLVHDSFVEAGYIQPTHTGMRIRIFETMPQTATFIARSGNNIIGVTSVVIDSPDLGLPSDEAFRQEINKIRRSGGRKICEGTNWFIDPEYRKTSVMTDLMRCCFAHAVFCGCTDMVADVSPTHKSFYEIMAFDTIGTQRSSSSEVEDPVVLVNLPITETVQAVSQLQTEDDFDLAYVKVFYIDDNPYYDQVGGWTQQAEAAFMTPEFLRDLFVERSSFIDHCSARDLNLLCHCWGEDLFLDVMGHSIMYRSLDLPSTNRFSSLVNLFRQPA
jgi:N-acyl amino acid synthase FeeM